MHMSNENKKSTSTAPKRGGLMGGGPMGGMGRPVEKAKNFKATLKRLVGYLAPQKKRFIIVGIFAVVSTIFAIFGPKLLGKAITKLADGVIAQYTYIAKLQMAIAQNAPEATINSLKNAAIPLFDFNYIGKILILMIGLYVVSSLCSYAMAYIMSGVSQKSLGELNGHVDEMYTGHRIVRVYNHEKESIDQFKKINERLYQAGWKAQFISGIIMPALNFVSNLGYVFICIIGGLLVAKRAIDLGDIQAFIQYMRQFTQPIVQMANIANVIQGTIASAERVFEVLDEEEQSPDEENSPQIDKDSMEGEVNFEHVSFRYNEDTPLIDDMNIHVKPGQMVAIVGPTGAGKTTMVNLLLRFYELNSGRITVDGIDIKKIARGDLRRLFGMVLQDTWLYKGTIMENIGYGLDDIDSEKIIEASKAAHADHFIRSLPLGYETILNEEASNISQGQKQLLTIARALLADPPILILDEATSSVDTRTEVLIQKAMNSLMEERTSFVIAHRLSTIKNADLILVMKNGSVVEQGTHDGLMKKKGFYEDLYNSQFTKNIDAQEEVKINE